MRATFKLCICRQGVAKLLVARCEELARKDPTVDAIALHVDSNNTAALSLYKAMGYLPIQRETPSPWTCLLGIAGEGPGGLLLMVKPLREVMLTGAGNPAMRRLWYPDTESAPALT